MSVDVPDRAVLYALCVRCGQRVLPVDDLFFDDSRYSASGELRHGLSSWPENIFLNALPGPPAPRVHIMKTYFFIIRRKGPKIHCEIFE
jgi:hypothetical protein